MSKGKDGKGGIKAAVPKAADAVPPTLGPRSER